MRNDRNTTHMRSGVRFGRKRMKRIVFLPPRIFTLWVRCFPAYDELPCGIAEWHVAVRIKHTSGAIGALGAHIALDDFGSGYSSFSYLKHFPLDVLKIDQSFVRDVTTDPDDAAIVMGMTELAHSLRLHLIAEGTETREQMEFLRRHHCDYAQGYAFSAALPADELKQVLQQGKITID